MAQLGSRQIAGYYPAPAHLVPRMASLVRCPPASGPRRVVLDPCAGEGAAVISLAQSWDPRLASTTLVTNEMEAERHAALSSAMQNLGWLHSQACSHADAFRLRPVSTPRATVLYLNPPYDTDPDFGRLEARWLDRFALHLAPGQGVLLFLIPETALRACAVLLSRLFVDLHVFRFPAEDFATYRQVLVLARRSLGPLHQPHVADQVTAWVGDSDLPELVDGLSPVLTLGPADWELEYEVATTDVDTLVASLRLHEDLPFGLDRPVDDLLGARLETALPPKPAHIALALSAGQFNGHVLEADDPDRHPRVLAKGIFDRSLLEVGLKRDREGEVKGTVAIETPTLTLSILRLDTYEFLTLRSGLEPASSDNLAEWTAADLLLNYSGSLRRLLVKQFPPLHDPVDPQHTVPLPKVDRDPFSIQSTVIQAALKLLSQGRTPIFTAEVGTGKSTMALILDATLRDVEARERAEAALGVQGLPDRLPSVSRTLIVCPPHLLQSWRDQIAAVDDRRTVQVLRSPSDLERDADFYILSRETAKLGHAVRGISQGHPCPRCGRATTSAATTNARQRARCQYLDRAPRNTPARLALDVAALLVPFQDHPYLQQLRPQLFRFRRGPVQPVPDRILERAYNLVLSALSPEVISEFWGLYDPFRRLLFLLERQEAFSAWVAGEGSSSTTVQRLRSLTAPEYAPQDLDPTSVALSLLQKLYEAAEWSEEQACGEPLYQSIPEPRRYPLAKLISRRSRHRFDLVVLDEAHEFAHASSAQTKAAERLVHLPSAPTVLLTGSLMSGYASSLFSPFWAASRAFRSEFERHEKARFVARYGYRKFLLTENDAPTDQGAVTDREVRRRSLGEAPGICPTFLLKHLLPQSLVVHKSDLDHELPPIDEIPSPIVASCDDSRASALLNEYRAAQEQLLECIAEDRFTERAGKLLGTLVELPSYLDRATDDQPVFELRYPENCGGDTIRTCARFPASWRTPKERWFLRTLREQLDRGRKVLVFLRHTGTRALPDRLLRLIRETVTSKAIWLDTKKVPTQKREAWIDRQVLEADVDVLLVNPNGVRTGLNNLVAFSTAVWYQLDASASTYRQANGRVHRIGQTLPVEIYVPTYSGTSQETLCDLVARKVSASLQVDGLDIAGALEAAGAGDDVSSALATAMSLGESIYRSLVSAPPA